MKPADIDRVFGRGRLKMMTGEHVEVFREPSLPGERRRYTKRFLSTSEGDFRHWTEREWRILARLVGHRIGPVPDVVQFDRGSADRPALVQTYDAGITVDHWATLLPVERDGQVLRHVFEDCAHWWALARHCLVALDAIHELQLVHLDLKADNVCIPCGPPDFDPHASDATLRPLFDQIALIDFAFSLVSGESLVTALPIGHQADYDYQSPRLLRALEAGREGDLQPTRDLDWRCDIFSLAAMLARYLPTLPVGTRGGWNLPRREQAQVLVNRLFDIHHGPLPATRPHRALIALTVQALDDGELVASLARGWTLALDADMAPVNTPTPVTRIAAPVTPALAAISLDAISPGAAPYAVPRESAPRWPWLAAALVAGAMASPLIGEAWHGWREGDRDPEVARLSRVATPHAESRKAEVRTADAGTPSSVAAPAAAAASAVIAAAPVVAAANPTAANEGASAPGSAASSNSADVAAGTTKRAESSPAAAETPARLPDESRVAASTTAPVIATIHEPAPIVKKGRPLKPAAHPNVLATAAPRSRASARPSTASHDAKSTAMRHAGANATAVAAAKPAHSAPKPVLMAKAATPKAAPSPAVAPAPSKAAPTNNPALASAPPFGPAAGIVNPSVTAAAPPPAPAAQPPSVTLASAIPAPVVNAPLAGDESPAATRWPDDFSDRSYELITSHVPRIAQHAERMVLRVLHLAAQADGAGREDDIRNAVRGTRVGNDGALSGIHVAPFEAKHLNESASAAFWSERNVRRALNLQARAFGANPLDREVAGNFAFYLLKQRPAQPELARQLALHALTLNDPQLPNPRVDDWTTFAIASALAGRQRDAANALYVTLAMSDSLDRPCRSALAAYASHGERMRAPTEAMLYRIREWGRSDESSFCRWPPSWGVSARAQ
jgi:hypothetical protein